MSQDPHTPCSSSTLLTFLAGAAIGGIVVALATPRSGPELRGDLKDLAGRARSKAANLASSAQDRFDEMTARAARAANDIKSGFADSVQDLRG